MTRIKEVLFILLFLFDISSQTCNDCECCKGDNTCDADRKCTNGCISGYWGDRCIEPCPDNCKICESNFDCRECHPGYNGNQCIFDCGKGCINNTCLQSGECTCKSSDFKGRYCSSCSSSDKYGDECNYTCPQNCGACTSQIVCSWCKNFFTYGSYCQYKCSVGCIGTTCNKNGTCRTGCKPGYTGNNCDSCVPGKYGQNCDLDCQSNCKSCLSSSNCTECNEGFYGKTCRDICSPGCHDVCSIATGKCKDCKQGFYGDFCNITKTCEDGFYGNNCSKSCKGNDRYCHKCLTKASGLYSSCVTCISGYYPQFPFGLNHSICTHCPSECKNKSCNSTGICSYGCSLGKWGITCKSNCTLNCSECNQIDGKCIKCINGTYTKDCSKICSANCSSSDSDQICKIHTGECINGCSSYSKYGNYCEHKCNETCKNQTCNWKTGQCSYGCVKNYHGYFCENQCASTCKPVDGNGKSLCNDSNGRCISGCKNGFHGSMCTIKCSDKCKNTSCYRRNAECLFGCIAGYDGMQCTQKIKEEDNIAVIVGSSAGSGVAILIATVLVLAICFIRHRRRKSTCEQENIERNGNLKTMKDEEETDKGKKDTDSDAIYAKPNKAKGTIVNEANSVYDTTFKNKKTFKGNNEYDVIGAGRKYTSNEDNERSDKVDANTLYDTTFDIRIKRALKGINKISDKAEENALYDTTFDKRNKIYFKGINERSDKAEANALYDQIFDNINKRALKEINERSDKADTNTLYDTTFDNGNQRNFQGKNDYAVISSERNIPPDDEKQHETCFGQNSSTTK